jgi:hypothetical protein
MRSVVPAVTPIAGHGERVADRDFDENDPDAIGVLDPHLHQTPGLCSRAPARSGLRPRQAGGLGTYIRDLYPDRH